MFYWTVRFSSSNWKFLFAGIWISRFSNMVKIICWKRISDTFKPLNAVFFKFHVFIHSSASRFVIADDLDLVIIIVTIVGTVCCVTEQKAYY